MRAGWHRDRSGEVAERGDQHRRRAVIVEEVRQLRAGDLVSVGLAEADALDAHGSTERRELALLVGARYWGPGGFGAALREALVEGRIRRPRAPPSQRPTAIA